MSRGEWITRLEPPLQKLTCLGFGRRRIDRRPLARKAFPAFEAPVAKSFRYIFAGLLAAEILEEPPPDNFADLRFVTDQ
jgi:hypothetical protein